MPANRHVERAEAEIYASTLLDAVAEDGREAVLAVRDQLEAIVSYNRSHVELLDAVNSQAYTAEQRVALVQGVFADCHPALVSVLSVMAERGDIDVLSKVRTFFNRLTTEKLNVNVVDVTTRVALDDHLREVIKNKAAADLGTDIILHETVDPDMLGGIIMSAAGQRIDASLNTLLEGARRTLKEN